MSKRRRTEIARITDPAARLVTYSKRCKGLFNKASELCRLCGGRAAVVVFSPPANPALSATHRPIKLYPTTSEAAAAAAVAASAR
ncbi:hypothetical protein NL676_030364 [Syzygium grande]|nr:hypothetical protein NL676_030364 [Syzygium grande]